VPLLCASACAWGLIAFTPEGSGLHATHGHHAMGAATEHGVHGHGHSMHPGADSGLGGDVFGMASVSVWAGMWVVMLVAMMLPLMSAPIRHVLDRSLAARRARSVLLFLAGYGALWLGAGVGLAAATEAVRASAQPLAMGVLAVLGVLIWQVSPWKQACLNRLHAHPALAAFGTRADRDALRFGVAHGFWCAGSCWGLMLLPLLVPSGHGVAMLAASFWMWGEQLERTSAPSWRWRAPLKAVRLVVAQAQLRLRSLGQRKSAPVRRFS
jgi:predicted metal-binding membrane protein